VARAVLAGPPRRTAQARDEYSDALEALGVADTQAGEFVGGTAQAQDAEIWPDQEVPLRLFCSLLTQWRMGAAGPVGLDYGVLPTVERRLGITPEQADAAFSDLQVMEDEALAWISEQQAKRR
jgi:hypothetical protein